ncbi:MAG: nucleotidyltransferase domain-containing protein [Candidatus Acidiferrales bacterium]
MEELLQHLKEKLQRAAGANLKAIVLYGSAVTGEYRKQHSDLNILCILERTGPPELEALHEAVAWWRRKGFQPPQVFTPEELRASADIFAIELLDMKANHKMMYGEDFFATLNVPTNLHKLQVERELRTNVVRLRQGILSVPPKDRVVVGLMDASVSAFVTLFRHALLALGDPVPGSKREVVESVARLVGSSPSAFLMILDVREGKRKASDVDAQETLRGFVELVERMTNLVDRRFEGTC